MTTGDCSAEPVSSEFHLQRDGSKVARIADIAFRAGGIKRYGIENLVVKLERIDRKTIAHINYQTNANYRFGSHDSNYKIQFLDHEIIVGHTTEMIYAAWCRPIEERVRNYEYKFEISENLFNSVTGIRVERLFNGYHVC